MSYFVVLFLAGWVLGVIIVGSNPSPYFGALGLVFVAGMGGLLLLCYGASYLCFVLLLVYLGGMLVVFAYTSAMAADPFPETLGSPGVIKGLMAYVGVSLIFFFLFLGGGGADPGDFTFEGRAWGVHRGDVEGVAFMFSAGGLVLLVCGWALLLALFVVMELVRGSSRGALRAV